MDYSKRDYLVKTLSRTKRKDYENYVINAIWHKLNRLDIQPITQQYIKRSDGKYALLDLYFPQLNFGIECDEPFHKGKKEADLIRELTVEKMLESYAETEDFVLRRIDVSKDIYNIDEQIEIIVYEIRKLLGTKTIKPWQYEKKSYEIVLEKELLCIKDSIRFKTITDIARCFGKQYKNMQRCYFKIKDNYNIWCPQLSIKDNEGNFHSTNTGGWINYLSEDWKTLYETNETNKKVANPESKEIVRITFARTKDAFGRTNYRFVGSFKFIKFIIENNTNKYEFI